MDIHHTSHYLGLEMVDAMLKSELKRDTFPHLDTGPPPLRDVEIKVRLWMGINLEAHHDAWRRLGLPQ
jgi:hypothetical protein